MSKHIILNIYANKYWEFAGIYGTASDIKTTIWKNSSVPISYYKAVAIRILIVKLKRKKESRLYLTTLAKVLTASWWSSILNYLLIVEVDELFIRIEVSSPLNLKGSRNVMFKVSRKFPLNEMLSLYSKLSWIIKVDGEN
jgi:hypothetical protein